MNDDENLVCFNKALDESKSNNAVTIEDRVLKCAENKDCKCKYCVYKNNAATMIVDFLARDVMLFEQNSGSQMCTYDLKDILFKAIMEIKDMEKDTSGEEV